MIRALSLSYDLLNGKDAGWFRELLDVAIGGGGVVWVSDDLFFLGVPEPTDREVLVILFAGGVMGRLLDLAVPVMGLGYRRVRWQRSIKNDNRWRELDLAKFVTFKRFRRS